MGSTIERLLPDAVARAERLPTLPAVAVEVLRLATDDSAELGDYVRALSKDPVLTGRIVELANSTQFRVGAEVTSIERASLVLGLKSVQLMALAFSLVDALPRGGDRAGFDYPQFWRRSLIAAVAARELGRIVCFSLADEAFLCGLSSKLGQLVLAECMPEEYAEVVAEARSWPEAELERDRLGFDHGDVAAALFEKWELPRTLGDALECAGDRTRLPHDADPIAHSLAELLGTANRLVGVLCDDDKGAALEALHEAAVANGLGREQADSLVLALETVVAETAAVLDIDLGPPVSHYEALEDARAQLVVRGMQLGTEHEPTRRESRDTSPERPPVRDHDRDERTGLGDESWFLAALDAELRRGTAEPDAAHPGLLLVDIAGLEEDHDRAHADELLQAVGHALRGLSRTSDVPARHSLAHFAILVPGATAAELGGFAERIRRSVAALDIPTRRGPASSELVVGGAVLDGATATRDLDERRRGLLERASASLRRAHAEGGIDVDG